MRPAVFKSSASVSTNFSGGTIFRVCNCSREFSTKARPQSTGAFCRIISAAGTMESPRPKQCMFRAP